MFLHFQINLSKGWYFIKRIQLCRNLQDIGLSISSFEWKTVSIVSISLRHVSSLILIHLYWFVDWQTLIIERSNVSFLSAKAVPRKHCFVRSQPSRRFNGQRQQPAFRSRFEPLPLILTSCRQASFQASQRAYGHVIGTLREKPSYGENNHPEIVASGLERPVSRASSSHSLFPSFSLPLFLNLRSFTLHPLLAFCFFFPTFSRRPLYEIIREKGIAF